ncbi:MAG: phosphate/phosphite/phosphonate ABC transporter substrate-binding protein [Desulfurivibrionaceae bacterium]
MIKNAGPSKLRGLALLLLAVTLILPARAAAQPEKLLIGLIPEINIFKQKQRFNSLGAYLSEKTGLQVQFTILSRYGNIIDSFTSERMDGAFFGSFTGAMAIRKLGVIPLARPVNPDGSSTYHGLLLVRKSDKIDSVADVAGKRMAFVDKATTAGFIFPLAYLRDSGISSEADYFGEYFFTGSHDAAIIALLDGRADIAAVKHSVYNRLNRENPRVGEELKVIAKSSNVPSNGLCVRPTLAEHIRAKLQKALLDLESAPEGQEVLRMFGALRFLKTTAADYQPVFEMAEKAGIDIGNYDYLNK